MDPKFSADLRALLESELGGLTSARTVADGARLVVTKDRLTRALACPVHRTVDRFGERSYTIPLACGVLVDALFRQIVTTGTVGDPMADAIDGLAIDERQAPLVAWIAALAPPDLAELRAEVDRQAEGLVTRWPMLEAAWLPRTQVPMRALVAGGRIELSARVDLVIGPPAAEEASVALVDLKSGVPRPGHRDDLRFYALVEALRSPAPPFAVATYYSRTGELDAEPVTRKLLLDAARRCAAGIRVSSGTASAADEVAFCSACEALPRTSVDSGAIRTGDGDPAFRHRRAA